MKEELNDLIIRTIKESGYIEVRELIDKVELSYRVNPEFIAKKIYLLSKDKMLEIIEPEYSSPLEYLLNPRSLWFWVLTLLISSTLPVIFFLDASPFIFLRYFLTSLYILYLPGFALTETLYPKREDLQPFERLGLSIGLSIALIVGVGFLLNSLPYGINLKSSTMSLAILTEGFGLIALAKKYKNHASHPE